MAISPDTNNLDSGWDIHDTPYFKELSISNRANGYQDIVAKIDLSTYRRLPWENNVPFFLISFSHPEDGKPLIACARSILNGVVKRFEEGEQKLECLAGAEFEVSSILERSPWRKSARLTRCRSGCSTSNFPKRPTLLLKRVTSTSTL